MAVKACDKALGESRDPVLRGAVEEARVGLAACLGTHGIVMPQVGTAAKPRGRKPKSAAARAS